MGTDNGEEMRERESEGVGRMTSLDGNITGS